MFLGPFLFTLNIHDIIILILAFWIYYVRIMFAEEAYLIKLFGVEYDNWSSIIHAFIPNIIFIHQSSHSFHLKTFWKRNIPGFVESL